ncbi:multidrug resistance-associated protein 1 isoform X2 [Onthophagus taurus]|uniref:multidrug resistance-associated protein 1 isoform X2 n=1 Tax=Onthophagus taurus TaxID=166361 RepID=UPI0039BDE20C
MASSGLDEFCGSEFWNSNLTWYTTDPDFTRCFEQTVLVWIPCMYLWIFCSLEVSYILQSKRSDIPWNFLNLSKLFVNLLLFVLCIIDFSVSVKWASEGHKNIHNVHIYTPIIKGITYILTATLVYYNRKHGLRTSGLLFQFWLLTAICGAPQFRSEVRQAQNITPDPYYYYVSYIIFYPLTLLLVFLNCFADQEARLSKYPHSDKPCPELKSSFLSKIFYAWFDPLAWKGYRNPLETKDLWDMNPSDAAYEVVPQYEKHWKKILAKSKGDVPGSLQTDASFKSDTNRIEFVSNKEKKQASILPAMVYAFGPPFLFGAFLKLLQDILTFVSPQLLRLLIAFVENKEEQWKGYLYAALLFITAGIQTLILAQYFHRMFLVGMRIRTALISTIYKKALKMSNIAKKESTVGEIVNLMSVDAQKFIELTAYLNMIWSAPFQIIVALYFLWNILGVSVLAGLAIMIIMIPINGFIADRVKVLQIRQMKYKDERVKLMNEVLSGMKVLKLYAWEPSFEDQILAIRTKEMKVLRQAAYLNAGTSFLWSCAPFLVTFATFITFNYSSVDNIMTPQVVFVSITLFNIMRIEMLLLPILIVYAIEAWVSIQRINKFMNCDELDPSNVGHNKDETHPLIIENGNFHWGDNPVLKDINVKLAKKSLTAVVGSVGSGKSSLLSALLGEMVKTSGTVNTIGSIGYVSQQAWIQNATLQDNILFGKNYNKKIYDRIVDACALRPDFEMLPAGDQTEIGEKGINLSGGQKQRVSLARAVYADADVYLLDDPLSAVDSHVGKHIFENVIGPNGLLKNKTRVLVTHGITYLPQTDKIVVIKDGEVSETGSYQELLNKKGAFADFLLQHITEAVELDDDEELDELQGQLSNQLPDDLARKLATQISRTRASESESGSEKLNGSLQHQSSIDKSGLRKRSSSSNEIQDKKVGEKLIEAEKAETGSVKWPVYKHYLSSIGATLTIATLALNIVFQGFSIGSNFWLTIWTSDESVVTHDDNGTIHVDTRKRDMYLGVYGALGIGQAFAMCVSSLALFLGTVEGARNMHNYILRNVMRAPCPSFFDVTPLGRVLNRFSKDIEILDNELPMTWRGWTTCLFSVIATLFVISFTTPWFVAVIVPIGGIYYFVQRFYVATSRQLKRLESVSRSPIYSHFGETVTGAPIIRAFNEQQRFTMESEGKVDFNQVCYYPSIIANRWLAVRLEMVGNLIILFAALFAVIMKDQEPGLVGLSVSYALQITQTLNWLVRMTSDVETNIVAVERIKEYGETKQEAPWDIPNKQPTTDWPSKGMVEFRDYAVRYREGLDLVLKGVNFTVTGGEKVGIVGRTGAGKSSLTLALFRIIEASQGQIYIDNINVSELGLHTLRSRLTIIPQDAVLFSGTLRMNLDPFNKHSDNDVWTALEHAHLKSFVKGLAAGLNHEVSEGGENLSVGQRQLICLSRALLRKTKVLILDEATAAVDLETDDLIQKTIRTEFKNCTVLTIAHRLNTIMDSDRVIVLDKGKIVEFDSPSNLLADKNTVFHGMCKDAGLV